MDFRVFSRNISENMHARCVREDTKQALTGNLQADGVQSRQTLFVRYCLISFMFLFRWLYVRQTHFELRIGMFLTADTDLCVVQVNDFFRNIQPQP